MTIWLLFSLLKPATRRDRYKSANSATVRCNEINTNKIMLRPSFVHRRLSRASAVKEGPSLGPPGGLVLDGCEHEGRLMRAGIVRMMALVVDGREMAWRRMTTTRIVEALDEIEDDDPCSAC